MSDTLPRADVRYLGALYEDIQSNIKRILEAVTASKPHILKIPEISDRVERMEYDMAAVKAAITATNQDLTEVKIYTEKMQDDIHDIKVTLKTFTGEL